MISGCLGAFIGLERQWDRQLAHPDRPIFAGLRTFTLWAIIGTLCAWVSEKNHPLFFLAGFLLVGAFVVILMIYRNRERPGAGLTTSAVAVLTYLIGGMVYWGEWALAIGISIGINLLLFHKTKLHSVSERLTPEDVRLALQFALLSGIILPLVPDQAFGPFLAFNPRSVWMMVVLVSGIGFAGYAAMRAIGSGGGLVITGLLGGLASSTATTLAMSRQSRERIELSADCALAIILACSIMPIRVGILVATISLPLMLQAWPALLLFVLPGLAFTIRHFVLRRKGESPRKIAGEIRNPLSLRIALQFAALYAVVVFVVKAAAYFLGSQGVFLASAISGLTDLDAIALSLADMLNLKQIDESTAARGILIATVANTFLKTTLACSLGSRPLRSPILVFAGGTALVAAIGWFLV